MQNKKKIEDINKYCKPNSILIITNDGILKRLFVPFKVVCLVAVSSIQKDDVVVVSAVKISLELILVYVINGKAYYYYYFN